MATRCTHVPFASTSACGKPVLMDGLCCRHIRQKCAVCFEPVGSINTVATKRLTCGHAFHAACITDWFVESSDCPTCRKPQTEDPLVIFKQKVENNIREKFHDAMRSMEAEVEHLRDTLAMQTMFNAFRTQDPSVNRSSDVDDDMVELFVEVTSGFASSSTS